MELDRTRGIRQGHILQSKQIVEDLYIKYEDDPYMINKLNNYIHRQLSNNMQNIKNEHDERVNRIQEMNIEQDEFIHRFIENNRYYYSNLSELFFKYDGINYISLSEDIVIQDILTNITEGRNLMAWKQKTKINIMKKIKEQNIMNSIPESSTIQNVLDLLNPLFFRNKSETKYFLTVLGDNILKKNNHLTHFINPHAKQFIRTLNNKCQMFFELDLNNTIKYKYKEHDYKNCRILYINDCIKNEILWNNMLQDNALNIFCVACHYSIRYENSDVFIQNHCNDTKLNEKIMYIANTDKSKLINEFVDNNLNKQDSSYKSISITWKNMQYLWKQFLERKNIPSVVFMNSLKAELISILTDFYDEENDCFFNIYCKNLPVIQKFLDFWNSQMENDTSETDLEIDEIMTLFKKWSNISLNEEQIIDLLNYYFPNIEIENGKYIQCMKCKLWDKQGEIQSVLENYKTILKEKYSHLTLSETSNYPNISLYEIYSFYCKTMHTSSHHIIANKMYFDKYVNETCQEYIMDNKFLKSEWYL